MKKHTFHKICLPVLEYFLNISAITIKQFDNININLKKSVTTCKPGCVLNEW